MNPPIYNPNAMQSFELVTDPFIGQVEYLQQLSGVDGAGSTPYIVVEMKDAEIRVEPIEKAVRSFAQRHESVRTIFPQVNGEMRQAVLPYDEILFGINYLDTTGGPEQYQAVLKQMYEETVGIFSQLGKGPLTRFFYFRLKGGKCSFSVLVHHVLCDAWSVKIIEKELIALYTAYAQGQEPVLPPLPMQLRDYCKKQNAHFFVNLVTLSMYWKQKLFGFDAMFDISAFYGGFCDRNSRNLTAPMEEFPGGREQLREVLNTPEGLVFETQIGNDRLKRIRKIAQQSGCSVSSVIFTLFHLLIFVYTGKNRVLVASLAADRNADEYRNLIGCLLGGIYLPRQMDKEESVAALMRKNFQDILNAVNCVIYNHDLLGIDGLALRVNTDIYLNYIYSPVDSRRRKTVYGQPHQWATGVYYAIYCHVTENNDDLSIDWRYNKFLFDGQLIEDLSKCYEEILDCLIANGSVRVGEVAELIKPLRKSVKLS
jgi:hypothetical protein